MDDTELMDSILDDTRRHIEMLPRDHLVLMCRKAQAELAVAKEHFANF